MAKHPEIEFSVVWDRLSIQELNMSQTGGFVLLVRAALFRNVDPFNVKLSVLRSISKSTHQQWNQCGEGILTALKDALPVLRERLDKANQKRANLGEHCRRSIGNWRAKQLTKLEAHNFESISTAPMILQPTKAPRYRPQNSDILARNVIVASLQVAKNNKSKIPRLTD